MLAEERRQLILDMLRKERRIVVKELAEKFRLSVDSIRRDLTLLEEQGLLKKSYGGAVPPPQVRTMPQPDAIRYGEPDAYRRAVARTAASYVQPNDSVFIGAAGIHYGILRYLPRDIPLTLVTNSLKIAQTVREWDNVEGYLIGGRLRASGGSMVDVMAIEQIRKFSLDIGFLTGGAFSANGISTSTPEGAAFARAVAEASRLRVGLAPHDKIGIDRFVASVPLRELDVIVTDERTTEDNIKRFESEGVQVIVAHTEHADRIEGS